jgi:hypothetical protein
MITERQIGERVDGLIGQFEINCIDIDVLERLDRLITELKSLREEVAKDRERTPLRHR